MHNGRLKLLVLTPAFPYPPVSGGDIRVFHLLRRLSFTFEVHLLPKGHGPVERLIEETRIAAVHLPNPDPHTPRQRRRWAGFWQHAPHQLSMHVDPVYAHELRRVVAKTRFDGVLIDHLYMMQYARFVKPIPIFYSATDVETTKFARWHDGERLSHARRMRHWAQSRVINWHESRIGKQALVTFATSAVDRDALARLNRMGRFVVVPNGVDLNYFQPRTRTSFDGPPRIFFVGSMFYRPNYVAAKVLAQQVFPLIRKEIPDATCHVVGRTSDGDYSELHRPELGIHMHGFVEDVRPYFAKSQILMVPLWVGSGTRIKILEAMATGTPVVSTAIGAEGIECSHGENIMIADTAAALAAAGVLLLRDRELCFRIGAAGRRLVEEKYSWDVSADVMRAEISRTLKTDRGQSAASGQGEQRANRSANGDNPNA